MTVYRKAQERNLSITCCHHCGAVLVEPTKMIDELAALIHEATGVTRKELRGRSRIARIKDARNAFIYFARKNLRCSYREIGDYLDGRDHSTILKNLRYFDDTVFAYRKTGTALMHGVSARGMQIINQLLEQDK